MQIRLSRLRLLAVDDLGDRAGLTKRRVPTIHFKNVMGIVREIFPPNGERELRDIPHEYESYDYRCVYCGLGPEEHEEIVTGSKSTQLYRAETAPPEAQGTLVPSLTGR